MKKKLNKSQKVSNNMVQYKRCLRNYQAIEEVNGTPLQYSCLETLMDGGAWWAAVHGVAGS